VPRVPEIIPKLLRLLLEEDMNVTALSRALAADPVLVAELYREANRPLYRPRYHSGPPISTIDGAIMLLGQSGMRMLLMRIALRPILSMQNGRLARRTAPLLWRQSEKCALAAGNLAPAMRAPAFEAYLAGLMQNVGLIVAFRLLDELELDDALPQGEEFIAALFAQARRLSAGIAMQWEFPELVATAIAQDDPDEPLVPVLALGDRLAKLRMLVDGGRFGTDDPFVTGGLSRAELANFERLKDEDEE
jgi:HD-like signal output (HDOD) protein